MDGHDSVSTSTSEKWGVTMVLPVPKSNLEEKGEIGCSGELGCSFSLRAVAAFSI